MQFFVGAADYYPVTQSPGKQIADASYDVSTLDVDAMAALIKEKMFDGMLTGFSDMLLPYYADICEKADIPCYGTKEQFEIFSHKDQYKHLLRSFGIPTVEDYEIDPDHLRDAGIVLFGIARFLSYGNRRFARRKSGKTANPRRRSGAFGAPFGIRDREADKRIQKRGAFARGQPRRLALAGDLDVPRSGKREQLRKHPDA